MVPEDGKIYANMIAAIKMHRLPLQPFGSKVARALAFPTMMIRTNHLEPGVGRNLHASLGKALW